MNTLTSDQVHQAVIELNDLCEKEYGSGLVEILSDPTLGPRQLKRLAGIQLKKKFATSEDLGGPSYSTHAKRGWIWNGYGAEYFAKSRDGAEAEFDLLNQIRIDLPEIGNAIGTQLDPTWEHLTGYSSESSLFKVIALWVKDKIEGGDPRSFDEYLNAPVAPRIQSLMDVSDIVFHFAMTPIYSSLIPIAGLVIPLSLLTLKFGYRQLQHSPDEEVDSE